MNRILNLALIFLLVSSTVLSQRSGDQSFDGFRKTSDDDDRQFTNVGQIGLTVTNFGTIGTRNAYWNQGQPSCEYPRSSRIEHMYQGALWVGARSRRTTIPHVSTSASDWVRRPGTNDPSLIDYEFTNAVGSTILQRSSLPLSPSFNPVAVSHQDLIANYVDTNLVVPSDTIIRLPNHTPLGLAVHQESYAWNFPFADFFVILNYTIRNVGNDTLEGVYVGLWAEQVVVNTKDRTDPRGQSSNYFNHSGHGDSLSRIVRMAYAFDYEGIAGYSQVANSYVGISLLGSTPFPTEIDSLADLFSKTFYNAWEFQQQNHPELEYNSPLDDFRSDDQFRSRYTRMTQSLSQTKIANLRTGGAYLKVQNILLSAGPFGGDSLGRSKSVFAPGDSINVVFGIVCAKKFGTIAANLDTREQRKILYANVDWAQRAYNGEDLNGNNRLDQGEDIVGRSDSLGLIFLPDDKLTRFLLPFPPRQPKVRAEIENQKIVIYWDKATSEETVDPISGQKDFEGYRVYRSNPGADFQSPETFLLNLSLVGEFDKPGNLVGYNTGFGQILLDSAKTFLDDTVQYRYRFPPKGVEITHLNGWQYIYGVSAFDSGDAARGLPVLESAPVLQRIIPGTLPTSKASDKVGVYPNPYYGNAYWDGRGERNRKIYFYNLPERCEIRIYTLAGDIVTKIDHDANIYNGSDIQWFQTFGDPQTKPKFAGGEHAWDLVTRFDQAVSSGLYLFTVKDNKTGEVKRGKFLVIK